MEPTESVPEPNQNDDQEVNPAANPNLGPLIGLAEKWGNRLPPSLLFLPLVLLLLMITGLVFGLSKTLAGGDNEVLSVILVIGVLILFALAMLCGTFIIIKLRILPFIATETEKRERSQAELSTAKRRLDSQPSFEALENTLMERLSGGNGATIAWIRQVPHFPMPQDLLGQLKNELVNLRGTAVTALADLGAQPTISADLVRVNIFIPDSRRADVGEVCGLYIPKGLHCNMLEKAERDLVFRTDEGLTGRVFVQEEAEGAVYDTAAKDWCRVTFFGQPPDPEQGPDYTLTGYQRELISDRLRWVMSFPLKIPDGTSETTVGVVNIDGLDIPLAHAKMKELFLHLLLGGDGGGTSVRSVIPAFSGILADCVFDRVAILLAKGRAAS